MAFTFAEMAEKRKANEKALAEKYGPDFAEPGRIITVSYAEEQAIRAWLKELEPEIMAIQGPNPNGDDGPYYGAIGGGVTYSFTPTGLGYILIVKEATTGKELNVSQALDWYFFD